MATWEERIYADDVTPDERNGLWEELTEELAVESRALLAESDFDHTFRVDEGKARVIISTEVGLDCETAKEVRDHLAGHEIGDESVTVAVDPSDEHGEPKELVPPIWDGHRVSVMLHEYLASKRVMESDVAKTVNELSSEMLDEE